MTPRDSNPATPVLPDRVSRTLDARQAATRHRPDAAFDPNPTTQLSLARHCRSSSRGRPAWRAQLSRRHRSIAHARCPAWFARRLASLWQGQRRLPQSPDRREAARTCPFRIRHPVRDARRALPRWPRTHLGRSDRNRGRRRWRPAAGARIWDQVCGQQWPKVRNASTIRSDVLSRDIACLVRSFLGQAAAIDGWFIRKK